MRVLILFDGYRSRPEDIMDAKALRSGGYYRAADAFQALTALGHTVSPCCVQSDVAPLIQRLQAFKPHVVFNTLETVATSRMGEPAIAALLELLRCRFTGCGFSALLTCKHKHLVHGLLQRHGIDTPEFVFGPQRGPLPDLSRLKFPVIVKPASRDASDYISLESYARSIGPALARVRYLHRVAECDAIVEEFIDGRELYVGVLGDRRVRTLAPRELVLAKSRAGVPRFATHNLKWRGTYRQRWKATYRYARRLPPALSAHISATVERAFRLLNIDGPARFDLKVTADNRIFVLDVNPNPPMSRQDEFVLAAKKSGIDYSQLMRLLLSSAKVQHCL
jgi:D-alanine-D-alanine ligase